MRFFTKFSLLAAALMAAALLSSSVSVRANDLTGRFTLAHSTQWNNTLLPAGSYTIQVRRTLSTSNLLVVRGEKESIAMLVSSGSPCVNCGEGSINMVSLGDLNVVTSIDIAGLHENFTIRKSAREREEEMAKNNHKPSSEQMAVHVDSNN